MKNLKSFPFERNRYFYGKLLSVEDFETEQKYFNDKRRTINRFLFGSGVVCGLHVVEVDEESISLEPGLALDFAGREIMVDEPVVKKIIDIEGYDTQELTETDSGFYYLCLEYEEHACELMHNVAGASENGGGEFNKFKEGYRLYVTQAEPEKEVFSPAALYEKGEEVYCGNGIRVRQFLPRYVQMGEPVMLRVEVQNMGQQQSFSFEYELALSYLTYEEETTVRIHFDEKGHAKDKKYILEVPVKAAYVNGVEAEASLAPGSFVLRVGDREYSRAGHLTSSTRISRRDDSKSFLEEYYKTAMDYTVNSTFRQSIYLAKIYVVKAADLCLIERVEQLPFGQYILHTQIVTALLYKMEEEIKKLKRGELLKAESEKHSNGACERQSETACGEVLFDLEGAEPGEVLYSDQIHHGLGFGPVSVVLGYEVADGITEGRETFFGDASVFRNIRDGFSADLGARLEASEGAFVIGMRVQKNDGTKRVRVRWTAQKHPVQREEIQKKRLFIQPDIPNLYTGESVTFTTVTEGFEDERIVWSVKDLDGGTIDKNGRYTAPETAGVYRIGAASTAYPEIGSSTFAVVREKEEDWLR